MRTAWALVALLLLTSAVTAQPSGGGSIIYQFEIEVDQESPVQVPFGGSVNIPVVFRDLSRDSTAGAADDGPSGLGFSHSVSFSAEIVAGNPHGWIVQPMPTRSTKGGETLAVDLTVLASNLVEEHTVMLQVGAKVTTRDGIAYRNTTLQATTDGLSGYSARMGSSVDRIQPGEIGQASIIVSNVGLFPETYHVAIRDNPCGLSVVPPASVTLPPRTFNHEVQFSVRGASDAIWFFNQDCSLMLAISPASNPAQEKTIPIGVVVDGGYLNPMWVFWAVVALASVLILFFIFNRRKQVVEEEILGKPQKPWTIPVERVYLEHLEIKDPRAAYVVRHFLMEEEYASSLLWYRDFKKATRGERSKETLVVRHEKKYNRFKRRWAKQIAAPVQDADKFDARLQRKLDRQAKGNVRKDRRAWKKMVAKVEKAVEAQNAKTLTKWERAVAKAEKKGRPTPPKPELESPDLPPEPHLQKIHLADYKWNKKAIKFRKKMVKRQGDLEVKFEKKDARMMHKLRKKVHKIARKLDDPDFVDEHPLLAKDA